MRVKGKLTKVDQFNSIIVKNHDGSPVYLSDVAVVKDTVEEQRSLSRFNGRSAVALDIVPQSGANVVDLADGVRATLAELSQEMPPDIELTVVNDNSTFTRDSIHEILFNIQFGTLLAVLVIFLFLLDIRPTFITGLSIPISIIATFTAMNFLGFTINFMTLLGLSLAVGILVDDSIVVVENIYRKIQEGETPWQAAFSGTKEIGLAVMATTFAIVVVFLPVAFMEGIVGRFFYQFGMTVACAVLISLFVAFSLVPMLASRTGKPSEDEAELDPKNSKGLWKVWLVIRKRLSIWDRTFNAMRPGYEKLLAASLRHRWLVVAIATLSVLVAGYVGASLDSEFMAETDQGKLFVNVDTPPGTTLEETSARIGRMEEIVAGLSEVTGRYVTIGSGNNPVTHGRILVLLTPAAERLFSAKQLVDSVRTLVGAVPGAKTAVSAEEAEGGGDKPVEFSIRGTDREELSRLTHKAQAIMRAIPGTIDVDNSLEEGKPEMQISIDRKMADDLGVNVLTISQTLRSMVEGEVVSSFKEGDQDHEVRIRLDEPFRSSEADVGRMLVASSKEIVGVKTFLVPLKRVARFEKETAIGEYRRYDRQPEVRVNSNVLTGAFAGTISNQAQLAFDSLMQMPPGYSIKPVGTAKLMEESFQNITRALLLSIIFIYLLLASQYESFFDPFSIMLSLPLSLVGAILGLKVFGSALNIMSMIGIVMLMGLVTKNAILLIDFVKQQRESGVDRTERDPESRADPASADLDDHLGHRFWYVAAGARPGSRR